MSNFNFILLQNVAPYNHILAFSYCTHPTQALIQSFDIGIQNNTDQYNNDEI